MTTSDTLVKSSVTRIVSNIDITDITLKARLNHILWFSREKIVCQEELLSGRETSFPMTIYLLGTLDELLDEE
jgi:hypothetical protein